MIRLLGDVLSRVRYYGTGIIQIWKAQNITIAAQAIGFKILITLVPTVILGTGILGQVLRRDRSFAAVEALVRDFLPAYQSDQLMVFLDALQSASGTLTYIGGFSLFVFAITLFTTLRTILHDIFPLEVKRYQIAHGYLLDVRMVLQVGLLFLLSMGISLALQTLNASGEAFLVQLGIDQVWIRSGWRTLFQWMGLLLPFVLSTAMFFQLFYFIPQPHPPARSALFGSLVTAILWEVAKAGFTFYATHVGTFERYSDTSAQDGLTVLGDAFGLMVTFVVWSYYSGLVFVIGAVLAHLHAQRSRPEHPLVRPAH